MPVLSRSVAVAVAVAVAGLCLTACTSTAHHAETANSSTSTSAVAATSASRSSSSAQKTAPHPSPPKRSTPAKPQSSAPTPSAIAQLPLPYATGSATEVITATAPSLGSTTGTLQSWQRVTGGWREVGPATSAWFGSQGLTNHMSEFISATPVGSYTLTQAFGSLPNPGTALPYFQTTPADWWISKTTSPDSALYNTHQHCSSGCAFDTRVDANGDPVPDNTNERLYYSQPYYRYAVVVDYNTRNAPGGVLQKAGSAVFLHVTVGAPTEGCVSVDQSRLVAILRWLTPSAHPRILIGVAG